MYDVEILTEMDLIDNDDWRLALAMEGEALQATSKNIIGEQDKRYIEIMNKFDELQKQINECNTNLVLLISKVNNINYVLNQIDPSIQL